MMAERAAGLAVLALALAGFGGAPVHAERLPPKDECSADPALSRFAGGLRGIVARRDAKALIGLVGPDATNGFGDVDAGPKGFAEAWTLDRPVASPVWGELHDLLMLGCARDGDQAVIPHLARRISEDHDPFGTYVATGSDIPVRSGPDQKAKVVATLDWAIVTEGDQPGVPDEWIGITEPRGYVRSSDLRSPIDYRLLLEQRRGRWMIAAFVGGD